MARKNDKKKEETQKFTEKLNDWSAYEPVKSIFQKTSFFLIYRSFFPLFVTGQLASHASTA